MDKMINELKSMSGIMAGAGKYKISNSISKLIDEIQKEIDNEIIEVFEKWMKYRSLSTNGNLYIEDIEELNNKLQEIGYKIVKEEK
jgi:hypothetical protein